MLTFPRIELCGISLRPFHSKWDEMKFFISFRSVKVALADASDALIDGCPTGIRRGSDASSDGCPTVVRLARFFEKLSGTGGKSGIFDVGDWPSLFLTTEAQRQGGPNCQGRTLLRFQRSSVRNSCVLVFCGEAGIPFRRTPAFAQLSGP
jgi:hypothetical protein